MRKLSLLFFERFSVVAVVVISLFDFMQDFAINGNRLLQLKYLKNGENYIKLSFYVNYDGSKNCSGYNTAPNCARRDGE